MAMILRTHFPTDYGTAVKNICVKDGKEKRVKEIKAELMAAVRHIAELEVPEFVLFIPERKEKDTEIVIAPRIWARDDKLFADYHLQQKVGRNLILSPLYCL